jgi:tRNA(Ile)-lysidine synthase
MARLGATETVSARVTVRAAGRGLEAAAREARYAVLAEVAQRLTSRRVLLGHTRDDQAETVLLGLTRGSGARSLSGMRASFEVFARPLLGITREQTEQACRAQGLTWWEDPHNSDPRFTRSRIRHTVMPLLEAELGPGVAAALARTAEQLAWDSAALQRLAEEALQGYDPDRGLVVGNLGRLDRAVRLRVLRAAAVAAGSPPGELFQVHVLALDHQVGNRSHLPRRVDLPGHVRAVRERDVLRFEGPAPPPATRPADST